MRKSIKYYGKLYRASDDPIASWGVLRATIKSLSAPQLRVLLRREVRGKRREIVLRTLTGRLNRIRAIALGYSGRLPKAEYEKQRTKGV